MLGIIFLDLGVRRLADACALSLPERINRKFAADLVFDFFLRETGLLDLSLVLVFGQVGILLSLLNRLIHLVIVGDEIVFLRPLKERLFLNQVVEHTQASRDQFGG